MHLYIACVHLEDDEYHYRALHSHTVYCHTDRVKSKSYNTFDQRLTQSDCVFTHGPYITLELPVIKSNRQFSKRSVGSLRNLHSWESGRIFGEEFKKGEEVNESSRCKQERSSFIYNSVCSSPFSSTLVTIGL